MTQRVTRSKAALILHAAFPDLTASNWRMKLQGNAITERKVLYRVPAIKDGKYTLYDLEEIQKYIGWVRLQRREKLAKEINGSPPFKAVYSRMVKAEARVKELQELLAKYGITE